MSKNKEKGWLEKNLSDVEIAFTVSGEEHEEAKRMAKSKGFSSVEKLMESKYQKFMKIYMGGK